METFRDLSVSASDWVDVSIEGIVGVMLPDCIVVMVFPVDVIHYRLINIVDISCKDNYNIIVVQASIFKSTIVFNDKFIWHNQAFLLLFQIIETIWSPSLPKKLSHTVLTRLEVSDLDLGCLPYRWCHLLCHLLIDSSCKSGRDGRFPTHTHILDKRSGLFSNIWSWSNLHYIIDRDCISEGDCVCVVLR